MCLQTGLRSCAAARLHVSTILVCVRVCVLLIHVLAHLSYAFVSVRSARAGQALLGGTVVDRICGWALCDEAENSWSATVVTVIK